MRIDPRSLLAPLLAAFVLAIVAAQTVSAVRASGVWARESRSARVEREDPYAYLDGLLARAAAPGAGADLRDPFAPQASVAVADPHRAPPKKLPPPPPPRPVLTSIVWDADPRATVRWAGRDYSIRQGSLFADFQVLAITRGQVTLERRGERIVLALPQKGDQ
jgi:hypothetical protein